jgi:ISXO2-like transposase domain
MTDDWSAYRRPGREFSSHESVNHSEEEWTHGEVHTQSVENFFPVFKRGMKGVYQHCSEKHLARYLHEFMFRYSHRSALGVEDTERREADHFSVTKRLILALPSTVPSGPCPNTMKSA